MSERKVLNKYYPPDFDPSKIPRARCPRNRQFTVRLMVPCNIKCYTCGEYIAKGKKFNARKEDVENMTYLGVRIYRFYIKCPGCLAEISFRTDPESTDYVIEAGAHRNFQALKLAEEQAAREEREAKEEIESNPMLLLENRTQQSQYEMEVLESLEDLRDMNERHAGIDLGKMTEKYENERKLTQEQREEAEQLEALKALGYEMIEGQMVKRVALEELQDTRPSKKLKSEELKTNGNVQKISPASKHSSSLKNNTMRFKMTGLIKAKEEQNLPSSTDEGNEKQISSCPGSESSRKPDPCTEDAKNRIDLHQEPCNSIRNVYDLPQSSLSARSLEAVVPSKPSLCEASKPEKTLLGLGLLGAYSDSSSEESD